MEIKDAVRFQSLTGKGVIGKVDGYDVAVGNRSLLDDLKLDAGDMTARAEDMRANGQTIMFVTVDGKPAGLIGVADPIKETTPAAVRQLHAEGIRIVMLTGDSRTTAEAGASKLGIE